MTLPPLRKSVSVPLPPADAFRLFTEGLGTWWPVESHSVAANGGARPQTVEVAPGAGGGITEIGPDGRKHPWARFTAWEEGQRLTMDWYPGQDPAAATEVEVTFTPEGNGTRLDLVHRGFAVRGTEATAVAKSYAKGWPIVLAAFAARALQTQQVPA